MSSRCAPIRSGAARSVLVATAIFVVRRTLASSLTMNRSPGPIFSFAGKHTATTSTSAQVVLTRSLSRSPSSVRGRCRPGVSTRISWASGRCTIPRMTVRVVCGLSEVIATLVPTSALVSVDLPAFGRPTNDANPLLCSSGSLAHDACASSYSAQISSSDRPCGLARPVDRAGVDGPRLALGGRRRQ